MAYYYSASKNAFYHTDITPLASMPSDKVALTDAEYTAIMEAQAAGKRIAANTSTGKPQAIDQSLAEATRLEYALSTELDAEADTRAAADTSLQANIDKKAPIAHAVSATTYGKGTNSLYGHVKLSDSTTSTSAAASGGVAATPAAVKAVQDAVTTLDGKVVHTTGAETVAGVKTFTSTPRISGTNPEIHLQRTDIAKGTTPSAAASHSVGLHDKNGVDIANTFSAVQFTLDTDGNSKAELYAFKNEASSSVSASLGITYPKSGDPFTYAPTPAAGDNSTKIATTAFVKSADDAVLTSSKSYTDTEKAKYLPLAGGTMTGNITGNRDEFTILKKDDAGSTVIRGGSAYASGASLILFGKDDENAGIARLVAHDGTSNNNIVLYPDGKATVGGSDIITSAGGQMEGPLRANTEGFVTGVADDDSVRMSGGTGWNNGASIVVYGKSHASYPGAFRIKAYDGTNENVMLGKPDGGLTWGGKNIVRSVNGANADAAGNVTVHSTPDFSSSVTLTETTEHIMAANGYLWVTVNKAATTLAGITLKINSHEVPKIQANDYSFDSVLIPVFQGDTVQYTRNNYPTVTVMFFPARR